MRNFHKKAIVFLFLTGIAFLAYSNSFNASFHFDDYHQVVKNPAIKNVSNLPSVFYDAGATTYQKGFKGYRPVTIASFILSYFFSSYDVFGYHLLNLLIHIFNSFFLYLIFLQVFEKAGKKKSTLTAALAAAAFAVHPVQTYAVTYISGRSVLLASFFSLAAILFFIRARTGRAWIWMTLSALAFLLGLLSKEMAVCTPFIAAAFELFLKNPGEKDALKRRVISYGLFSAVLALYLAARVALLGNVVAGAGFGAREYLISEGRVFLLYLRLLFFPFNQNADYNLEILTSINAYVIASALIVVLLVFAMIKARKANPAGAFFCAWFLITLAPESSFVPILDVAQEYRLYLASAGVFGAIAAIGIRAEGVKRFAVPAVLVMLSLLTFNRNFVWADEYSFWSDIARKAPGSARARAGLGYALMQEGRYDEAIKVLRSVIEKDPLYPERSTIHNNIGFCLVKNSDIGGGISEFKKAIATGPDNVEGYANLGDAYLRAGMHGEALEALLKGKAVNPEYAFGLCRLADAYAGLGMFKEELSEMLAAAEYSPDDFMVRYDLAVAYFNNGMANKALGEARAARELAADEAQKEGAEELIRRLAAAKKAS